MTEPSHWKDELAWRFLKLPEATKNWLLEEAINKTMKEGRRECLPAAGPMSTLYARSCRFWPALASLSYHRFRKAFAVLRANGKG